MKDLYSLLAAAGCLFTVQQTVAATGNNNLPTTGVSIADTSRIFNLDEIVVVSQPKESTLLRNQPLSSSIFSSIETGNLGIRGISELAAYVPSFQVPDYGSRLTSSMYIRGIGSRVNNPAVGLYIDGMPVLGKSAYNIHIYEIDRADVLRGPQGTLYGMNTEGGLLRLYSKNPMTNNGTDVKLGIGSRMSRNIEAATYNKLGANTALGIASFYNGTNGFFRNQTTGKRADSFNEAGAKIRLTHSASNRWYFDFTSDYQYVNQNGFPYGEYNVENGKTASPATNRDNTYRRNILNSALSTRYTKPGITVTSTTSYQFLRDAMLMDQDYTALDYMHLQQRQLQNGVTQEFAIKRNKKAWRYTTGVFGSYLWQRTEAPVFFDEGFKANLAATIETAAHGMIKVTDIIMSVPGLFHTPQYNIGLFHESSVDITNRLTMTVGLRYDYSHTKIHYQTSAAMDMTVSAMGRNMAGSVKSVLDNCNSSGYNQILPKLGFTLKTSEYGSNLYVLVNKGYRAGGYNIQMFSDILQAELQANRKMAMSGSYDVPHTAEDYNNINSTISYKPEFSWNYEAGTHLNLFSGTVQADFSVYYMKIRNQQLSVMAGKYGFGRMMVNAGRSHSCGAEASMRGKFFNGQLSWNATYSYTRSVFDYYSYENNGTTTDYAGNCVPFIPQHAMSVAADWTIPFAGSGIENIVIGANLTAQGKTFWDEANTYSQDFYAVAGMHADANFKNLSISVWGKNITSTKYNTFAFSSNATGKEIYFAQRGMPMHMGIDVKIHL